MSLLVQPGPGWSHLGFAALDISDGVICLYWDDWASFHLGVLSTSRWLTWWWSLGSKSSQRGAPGHKCFPSLLSQLLLFHWPKQVTCSCPELLQEGTTQRFAVRETCTIWGHSSSSLSQCYVCMHMCVCVHTYTHAHLLLLLLLMVYQVLPLTGGALEQVLSLFWATISPSV